MTESQKLIELVGLLKFNIMGKNTNAELKYIISKKVGEDFRPFYEEVVKSEELLDTSNVDHILQTVKNKALLQKESKDDKLQCQLTLQKGEQKYVLNFNAGQAPARLSKTAKKLADNIHAIEADPQFKAVVGGDVVEMLLAHYNSSFELLIFMSEVENKPRATVEALFKEAIMKEYLKSI